MNEHVKEWAEDLLQFLKDYPDANVIGISDGLSTPPYNLRVQVSHRWFANRAPDDCSVSWHNQVARSVLVAWEYKSIVIHGLFNKNEPCKWRGPFLEELRLAVGATKDADFGEEVA